MSEHTDTHGAGLVGAAIQKWRVILIVALTVAAVGFTAWFYVYEYRPDQKVDAGMAAAAKKAAEDGTVAVLSYSPDHLKDDIANAKSHLTGGFLEYYTHFTDQIFAAAAQQQRVSTTTNVVRAAVSDLHPDSAVVLLFVNKVSTSKDNPTSMQPTTVKATMKKVDGSWLIEQFEPL
jgi:Mce-associated membrane protein